jgi:TolB protein
VYRKIIDTPGKNWSLADITRNSEVFVANADGTGEVNLSDHPAFDGWPVWAPDGERIVFASNRAGPPMVGQLYIIKTDGTGLTQITTGPWSHVQPAWSRDGTRIFAYQHQETETYEFGDVVVIEVPSPETEN